MSRPGFLVIVIGMAAACGGDDGGSAMADAPIELDAPPSRACASNPAYIAIGTATNRYRVTDSGLRWAQARGLCDADEAHLAFVNDQNEFDQVTGPGMPAGFFVGVSDYAVEGEWRLLTGDPAPYLPWGAEEPNGGLDENYGELGASGLNDLAVENLRPGLCECEL